MCVLVGVLGAEEVVGLASFKKGRVAFRAWDDVLVWNLSVHG